MLDCSCKVKDNFLSFLRKKVNKLSEKLLQRFFIEIGWSCFDLYLFCFHYIILIWNKKKMIIHSWYDKYLCIAHNYFFIIFKSRMKIKIRYKLYNYPFEARLMPCTFFLYIETISRKWFIQTLCFVSKFSIKWIPCHV